MVMSSSLFIISLIKSNILIFLLVLGADKNLKLPVNEKINRIRIGKKSIKLLMVYSIIEFNDDIIIKNCFLYIILEEKESWNP